MVTLAGISITLTGKRTGEVAEILIVMLWTLAPAVTDMVNVQTDGGTTTAIETRAGWRIAMMLVHVT